jgi:hypothetical protein
VAVILPNCALTVTQRAHPWVRDARGTPVPTTDDATTTSGPFPGAASEEPDATWALRLDPRSWPVRAGDQITDGTRVWVAYGLPKLHEVPGAPAVDHVAVTATLEPPQVP